MTRASSVTIELDFDGVGKLLASSEVQGVMDRAAQAVADAASSRGVKVDEGKGEVPVPVTVTSTGTAKRARATVTLDHPAGLRIEAKHRLLVGSLDAARNA